MEKYMKDVCGSDLWDPQTIYSSHPDFTFCFRYTLLIWIPCLFLWLAAPFRVFKITKINHPCPMKKWLFYSKNVMLSFLVLIEVFQLVWALKPTNPPTMLYLTPSILLSTYILLILMIRIEHLNGWPHSVIAFLFWLLIFISFSVSFRSNIISQIDSAGEKMDLLIFYAKYSLIATSLVLSTISEPSFRQTSFKKTRRAPEKNSPLLSVLTFWWINHLINTGFKRDLTREDLWEIDASEKLDLATRKLENVWNPKAQKYISKMRLKHDSNYVNFEMETLVKKNEPIETIGSNKTKIPEPSLGLCLVQIHIYKFIGILLIKISHDMLNFLKPYLLDKLITFVKDKDQTMTVGLFFIFSLCLLSLTQTLINQHFHHKMFLVGQQLKNSLMNIIFRKSLNISTSARKSTTIGEMTNLITTNAATFERCLILITGMMSTPIQIVTATYFLWQYLGWATLAGLASMVLFIPINVYFTRKTKKLRIKKHRLEDSRIKSLNEVFSGIRVIKLMGWEKSFEKLVNNIRGRELTNLIHASLLGAISALTWSLAPFMVGLVAFATFIFIDEKNNLDPNTAFVSLTLFNMLRHPLNLIPRIIQGLIQLNVSMTRIRKFLLLDEIQLNDISHQDIPGYAVNVENADFGWNKSESCLKNLSMEVKKGKLIAIVGKVGSGKSSLLSALLGEMHKLTPSSLVNLNGSTAYVPQQAWIKNATVRSNILFTQELDDDYYDRVLEACALKPDLMVMAAGDQTEIGEKGINLSGGQKQRISLARAIYGRAEIYLLDDPLSAVDSHVGKHIFDKVIGPNGLLKDKTRLFVTNSLGFLPQTDYVYLLDGGCVVDKGSYEDLIQKNGHFFEFMRDFLASKENHSKDQPKEPMKQKVENNEKSTRKYSFSTKENQNNPNGKIIVKEKIESGTVKFSVILEYIKSCRLWISVIFVLLYILSHVSDIGSNFWLSDWSNDAASNPEASLKSKYHRLVIYAALGFSKSLIMLVGNLCFVAMFIKATKTMHVKLLDSMLRGTLRFYDSTPIGRIVNRFTKDIEATEDIIPNSIKTLIECLLSIFSTVFIISTTTPVFLIALVPVMILYVFFQRYFIPSNRQLKRLQSASKSPIYSHFSETQSGVSTIRAYRVQDAFSAQMEKNIDEYYVLHYGNVVSNRWMGMRLEIIGNMVTIMAALFAIVQRDTLSAGLAGLSISISLTISHNLNLFVRTSSEFEANITSVERIFEYYNIPHEADWEIESKRPPANWPQKGRIDISNLIVSYRPDFPPVINNLSLKIEPGEKIGIVGRTGSGKSTLAIALFRLIEPINGQITIDDININEIGLHDLRHNLTMIPQDPIIYSGTIRFNLDPFSTHTDSEIWSALKLSHLYEFVSSLEGGLDYMCAEHGSNLSAGQRQLMCLARALLRKTRILVLDEATASIDHNTDELIQESIRNEFKDCTILTIAHRLNTILDSSRILVIQDGHVAEFDTPKSLLENKQSIFYSMAKDANLVR